MGKPVSQEFVVRAANEAFGCFAFVIIWFSCMVTAALAGALIVQYLVYGGF